jgi:hypothetical protein
MNRRGEKSVQGFGGKARRKKDYLEYQGIDWIRMDLREIGWRSVEWLHLAQDRDQWQALVNIVITSGF